MNVDLNTRVIARLEEDGKLVEERVTRNFFTEVGEAYLADRLSDRNQADGDIDGMEISTGSGKNRAFSSTSLGGTFFRKSASVAQGTGADDNDCVYTTSFGVSEPSSQITVTEGALYSTATASTGTPINYFEFSPGIVKATSQTLTITVTITVGAS